MRTETTNGSGASHDKYGGEDGDRIDMNYCHPQLTATTAPRGGKYNQKKKEIKKKTKDKR